MSKSPPAAPTELSVAILVVSTTAAADPSTDASTKLLADFFAEASKTSGAATWAVKATKIVADHQGDIQHAVSSWADAQKHNLIVTTGGTGFAVSDATPEVC
jgi:gephyrin